MASTWGTSWGTSWGSSWNRGITPPVVVTTDTHDGWWREEDGSAEKKKIEEFVAARDTLRSQIADAFESVTGEAKVPESQDMVRAERNIKRQPRAERPQHGRRNLNRSTRPLPLCSATWKRYGLTMK